MNKLRIKRAQHNFLNRAEAWPDYANQFTIREVDRLFLDHDLYMILGCYCFATSIRAVSSDTVSWWIGSGFTCIRCGKVYESITLSKKSLASLRPKYGDKICKDDLEWLQIVARNSQKPIKVVIKR